MNMKVLFENLILDFFFFFKAVLLQRALLDRPKLFRNSKSLNLQIFFLLINDQYRELFAFENV